MPVAGLRQVVLEFSLGNGDRAVNVFHVKERVPTTFNEAEAVVLETAFEEEWWDVYKNSIVTSQVLEQITVRDMSGETGLAYTNDVNSAGLSVGQPLPFQVALCMSWRTATNGRSYRGRSYISGWNEAANTAAGRIDAAAITLMTTAAASLVTALDAAEFDLVVYSRKLDTAAIITTQIIDNRWDIQRRRDNV